MSSDSPQYFGFLTVTEHPRHGLIGGYLLLNHLGRPVEFHCTTPVRANRAQEILYGATLEAFLYGEQVGRILVQKTKSEPNTILTDHPRMLAVQDFVPIPVAYVPERKANDRNDLQLLRHDGASEDKDNNANDTTAASDLTEAIDSAHGISAARWSEHEIGRYRLAIPESLTRPAAEIAKDLKGISHTIDFLEPFERIRLAVEEAQKAA